MDRPDVSFSLLYQPAELPIAHPPPFCRVKNKPEHVQAYRAPMKLRPLRPLRPLQQLRPRNNYLVTSYRHVGPTVLSLALYRRCFRANGNPVSLTNSVS